jgi:hypothetical protein
LTSNPSRLKLPLDLDDILTVGQQDEKATTI